MADPTSRRKKPRNSFCRTENYKSHRPIHRDLIFTTHDFKQPKHTFSPHLAHSPSSNKLTPPPNIHHEGLHPPLPRSRSHTHPSRPNPLRGLRLRRPLLRVRHQTRPQMLHSPIPTIRRLCLRCAFLRLRYQARSKMLHARCTPIGRLRLRGAELRLRNQAGAQVLHTAHTTLGRFRLRGS